VVASSRASTSGVSATGGSSGVTNRAGVELAMGWFYLCPCSNSETDILLRGDSSGRAMGNEWYEHSTTATYRELYSYNQSLYIRHQLLLSNQTQKEQPKSFHCYWCFGVSELVNSDSELVNSSCMTFEGVLCGL
jgi:hypothetical protein